MTKGEVTKREVIEVGSFDHNSSLRSLIESWGPCRYVGVDIRKGPGVDVICSAENLVKTFGKESFDIVISTELIEHVADWKGVMSNIKKVCRLGGVILITTRSRGYLYHPSPGDFWRYELEDMKNIFSDCDIQILERDCQVPGVHESQETSCIRGERLVSE